jgi:hypothetical protein
LLMLLLVLSGACRRIVPVLAILSLCHIAFGNFRIARRVELADLMR